MPSLLAVAYPGSLFQSITGCSIDYEIGNKQDFLPKHNIPNPLSPEQLSVTDISLVLSDTKHNSKTHEED